MKQIFDSLSRLVVVTIMVFALLGLVVGCGQDAGVNPLDTTTGVEGLNSPQEILSLDAVKKLLKTAQDIGVNVSPELGFNPPDIEACYFGTGTEYFPNKNSIGKMIWKYLYQKDNNIRTQFFQENQSGEGRGGEIIRGEGNDFTVYSVLIVQEEDYSEKVILVMDGHLNEDGSIIVTYIVTSSDKDSDVDAIGIFEFTPIGCFELLDPPSHGSPVGKPFGEAGSAFIRISKR